MNTYDISSDPSRLDLDALYASHGFKPLAAPDRFTEIHRPDAYRAAQ